MHKPRASPQRSYRPLAKPSIKPLQSVKLYYSISMARGAAVVMAVMASHM
jgi:hypothetical protein